MRTNHRKLGLYEASRIMVVLCLWGVGLYSPDARAAEPPSAALRCGIAKADITPTKPVRMAGYASRKELSQGVHDPLSARAVAFECGGKRAVLVSLDNLGFYNDTAAAIRAAVLERCKLEPSELMLCAIHTHSAPSLTLSADKDHPNNVEYTRTLAVTTADLVERALGSMEPVSLGVGKGYSPVGMNRREKVTDGDKTTIRLGRNAYGPTDKEIGRAHV
jgi:neutral ceramidase